MEHAAEIKYKGALSAVEMASYTIKIIIKI